MYLHAMEACKYIWHSLHHGGESLDIFSFSKVEQSTGAR